MEVSTAGINIIPIYISKSSNTSNITLQDNKLDLNSKKYSLIHDYDDIKETQDGNYLLLLENTKSISIQYQYWYNNIIPTIYKSS